MPNLQLLEVYQGEDRTFNLAARDNSNNPTSLTGKTISWSISFPPYDPSISQALLTKTGNVTSASGGLYTVTITAGDTACLTAGNYGYQAFTTDTTGAISYVTVGPFRVRSHIWPSS